jgi:TrfA protein
MCKMGKGFNTAADVPLLKHLMDRAETDPDEPWHVQKPPAELSPPLLKGRQEENNVIQLPLWHELERGTPNSFLRSALFSAIQSKDRQYLKEVTLASSKDVSLKFTGEQLNQEDLTVWEALVHLARTSPLGNICNFTAHGLLKSLELHTGGAEHRRLHSTIIRLAGAVVEIKHEGKQYFGTLIQSGVKDELTKHYAIRLSPELIRLYGETQWTALNWNQRLQLRSKSLAQALHGYYSSHNRPYPVKLVTLQLYTGSQNSDSRSFKRQVNRALKELLDVGFLDNYHLDRNLVTVWRKM